MLLGLVVAGVVWFAFADWNTGGGKAGDVQLSGCDATDGLLPSVNLTVEVTNHSNAERRYIIEYEVVTDSGRRVGTGLLVVPGLRPGQTATESDATFLAGQLGQLTTVTCRLTKVR